MDCPIDSLDLPATGEANHKIGDCHCYLCTCGHHQCPSNSQYRRGYPVNTYNSIYQKDFLKKATTDTLRYVREGEILPSSQKMDLETTQRSSFKTHSNSYCIESPSKSVSPASYKKFTNSSTYRSNYPDWKHYYTFDYRLKNKYSGSPIKFSAVSTYGQDFQQFSPQPAEKRAEFKTPSLIGCKDSETGRTTHQITYKPHKVADFAQKRSASGTDYTLIENVGIYSTYQKNYLPYVKRGRVPTKKQTAYGNN